MRKLRIFSLLLALLMALSLFAACKKTNDDIGSDTSGETDESGESGTTGGGEIKVPVTFENGDIGYLNLDDKVYGENGDYWSLYAKYGKEVTTDDVQVDDDGNAYIVKDGKNYLLGLDFLSMAMVYNCGNGDMAAQKAEYAKWWQWYIERWNKLLPEMPLYSNEYYDVYNTKISGVKENPTNPYWGTADALIDWTSSDGTIIIGNSTELSGTFRYATFGASSPGAADLDIQNLITGLGTVVSDKNGDYVWNSSVVKSHKETENADGTKTFEIEIYDDLKFSDGSAVTAKDYVAFALVFSTPVAAEAAGKDHRAAMQFVGYDTFAKYDGTAGEGKTKELSGLRLLGDYKFSVTIAADYLPYFYDVTYASFSAHYAKMWIGDAEIKDDGNGCYLTDAFYAKSEDGKNYVTAAHIKATAKDTTSKYPYSGAYVVESYDASGKVAVLKKNTYFKGNYEGTKPAIEKVTYKKIVSATQLADLKAGGVDVLAGVTGGDATKEVLKLIEESNGKFASVNYSRAGYGKLGYRCDFGPAQFTAVRQAIAYSVDRESFAKNFTGGYGSVSNGPYYTGSWMYKAAVVNGLTLNAYAVDTDKAIALLEADGWIYDAAGNAYTSGVRYKKIAADQIKEDDKTYQSKSGKYKTTKVGDYYYMPLVINWFGTTDNDFTDMLVTDFQNSSNIAKIGMVVENTFGDFYPMLAELIQNNYGSGTYGGTPMYSAFNFATGFTSAVYDYSYQMTVDPDMYDDWSAYYIIDTADLVFLK